MSSKSDKKPTKHSQGGLMVWHGMKVSGLFRFFKSKPALHWSRLHRILTLPISAVYNSIMSAAESAVYGRRVRNTQIEHAPLFVLGYWRSGTTLLQTLLSQDPNFQHLPLYRALFPWHFLLTEGVVTRLTAPFVPKARPMDNMKISWDAPQEGDMALCVMSQVSPIQMASHPHDHSQFWRSLDFSRLNPAELKRWKDSLQLLVRKLTYSNPQRVLMKSPFHMYHVPLLREMFPDARFLYIRRNPYHVFRSAVHLRHRAMEENCLGRCRYGEHEDEVIKSQKFGFDVIERDRKLVPENRLHEIAYEDLEADPIGVLRRAYDGLELPGFEALETALQPQLESLKAYRKNQFDDDPAVVEKVYEELQPLFERYGYAKPEVLTSDATEAKRAAAV